MVLLYSRSSLFGVPILVPSLWILEEFQACLLGCPTNTALYGLQVDLTFLYGVVEALGSWASIQPSLNLASSFKSGLVGHVLH